AHCACSSADGVRQHVGSGQLDCERSAVSAPRNQRACSNGMPTDSENNADWDGSTTAVHQYVPTTVSVYRLKGRKRSMVPQTSRQVQYRQEACPSMTPQETSGKYTPSI